MPIICLISYTNILEETFWYDAHCAAVRFVHRNAQNSTNEKEIKYIWIDHKMFDIPTDETISIFSILFFLSLFFTSFV